MPDNIQRMRRLAAELRQFLQRWRGKVPDEENQNLVIFEKGADDMERRLERHWLASLRGLVEKKQAVLIGRHLLGGIVTVSQIAVEVKTMDAAAQAEFQKALGEGYDIEEDFRDAEKSLSEKEADFAKELAEVRTDWGDRLDAALMARLESASSGDITEWARQVSVATDALKEP